MATISPELESLVVPPEVLDAYFDPTTPESRIQKIGNGMVNLTFLAEGSGGSKPIILQRLSPMFDERVVEDATVIADHLATEGWEVPQVIPTLRGESAVRDNERSAALPKGWLWRATSYIACEEQPTTLQGDGHEAVGALLGRLHRSLGMLAYTPKYHIEHFHNTQYHLDTLRQLRQMPGMPGWAKDMAAQTLANYKDLPVIPAEVATPQLIHADPRTDNMLFREGKPFTLIDFDTFMVGSVWVDVGDLLRSLAENTAEQGRALPIEDIRRVVEGYREAVGSHYDADDFFTWSTTAAKRITLELTARFLNDTVVPYFAPDPDRYASRHEFDQERAELQRRVYDNLDNT